jgi:hypothetical protein
MPEVNANMLKAGRCTRIVHIVSNYSVLGGELPGLTSIVYIGCKIRR